MIMQKQSYDARYGGPIEHSITVVEHMLKGFVIATEAAISINSFPSAPKVVFGWESIKKCIKHEFHEPFWGHHK